MKEVCSCGASFEMLTEYIDGVQTSSVQYLVEWRKQHDTACRSRYRPAAPPFDDRIVNAALAGTNTYVPKPVRAPAPNNY